MASKGNICSLSHLLIYIYIPFCYDYIINYNYYLLIDHMNHTCKFMFFPAFSEQTRPHTSRSNETNEEPLVHVLMSLAERSPLTRFTPQSSCSCFCNHSLHWTRLRISTQLAAEFLIPLKIRESGGVSEAFGKRVAVNLQFGYLQQK